MLSPKLVETLVRRRLLGKNSKVELINEKETFLIKNIEKISEMKYIFDITNSNYTKERRISNEHIIKIDGMYPAIFAEAYDIKDDGDRKVLGKRRGRPRKHFRPEIF